MVIEHIINELMIVDPLTIGMSFKTNGLWFNFVRIINFTLKNLLLSFFSFYYANILFFFNFEKFPFGLK